MQKSQSLKLSTDEQSNGKKETISELAHRHLTDENHTTSDEELMNAKVELSSDAKAGDEDVVETVSATGRNDEAADDEDTLTGTSPVPNPYDVIGS